MKSLLIIIYLFLGLFVSFIQSNALSEFIDAMSPFKPTYYLNISHDTLMEVLHSIKTNEDLGNVGEALFVYYNTMNLRNGGIIPPLGTHSSSPPSTVSVCSAFYEGFHRQYKIPQFYKIFYVLKLNLADVDRPCPMDVPMEYPPNEYSEWELLFFYGKLVPKNYQNLPPEMFKFIYGRLTKYREHDVLEFLNSLFLKKITLSEGHRKYLKPFFNAQNNLLQVEIDKFVKRAAKKQAAFDALPEMPLGGRKKDYAIFSPALLAKMFLHFSVPISECPMVSKLYSPVCSRISHIVDHALSDDEMLLFVRLYPGLLVCLFSQSINDSFKEPIIGVFRPTMMKLLMSKARSDSVFSMELYSRDSNDNIHFNIPYSFLDANIRAFPLYSSWSISHYLAKDLLFFARLKYFHFLQEIFDSGYSRLIETFIFYLVYRSTRLDYPLSKGVEFEQLPLRTQFSIFFVLPNMYYTKWRLSEKLYDWYFRTMSTELFFKMMKILLNLFRSEPSRAIDYVHTLYNCMNYENFGSIPTDIAMLHDFENWLASIYPLDQRPWSERQFSWTFKRAVSHIFAGDYITYAMYKEVTSPQQKLEIFLNICDRTSADFYQRLTKTDLLEIIGLFPRCDYVVSTQSEEPACSNLLQGSPALMSINQYCQSCFNELGTYLLNDLVISLIDRLNHKNVIIGSKVKSPADRIDRTFLDNFYLTSFKNKRLFPTILSLLLRANSFTFLLVEQSVYPSKISKDTFKPPKRRNVGGRSASAADMSDASSTMFRLVFFTVLLAMSTLI